MNLIQFFRIFWAGRWIILAATVSCLIGGLVIIKIVPPRYQATARVMLDVMKPDPLTGASIGAQGMRAYVNTQVELIKDYSVAGKVVDEVGWLSDPALIAQYQSRPATDDRDFRRWLAQRVIAGTDAGLASGSSILEIRFNYSSPIGARTLANAVRDAYIDQSLSTRRDSANKTADWFTEQAARAQTVLTQAEATKTAYERQEGIVLGTGNVDLDTASLQALATAAANPAIAQAAPQVSPQAAGALVLAEMDSQISQQSMALGPNHPIIQELKRRRSLMEARVQQERSAQASMAGASVRAGVGEIDRALQNQKSKVIAQRDKIERLRQMQTEIDLRRSQYDKLLARAADLRQEGLAANAGLTPLGTAVTPQSPSFPNKPLILLGSLGLGLALGCLVALLTELLARRVRGPEDLEALEGIPVLAILPSAKPKSPISPFGWLSQMGKSGLRRPKATHA